MGVDADRAILVDERGEIVDGDAVLAMAGQELKASGLLRDGTVFATVMSNLGLELLALVMVEGEDLAQVRGAAGEIAAAIRTSLS